LGETVSELDLNKNFQLAVYTNLFMRHRIPFFFGGGAFQLLNSRKPENPKNYLLAFYLWTVYEEARRFLRCKPPLNRNFPELYHLMNA